MSPTAVLKRFVVRGIGRVTTLAKETRKGIYYRVRETPQGRRLLQKAEFIRSPRDHQSRRDTAQSYVARAAAPVMESDKGFGLTSVEKFENFSAVVETARCLFEKKKALIDEELASFPTWDDITQQKYLKRKDRFLRNLLSDQDLEQNPLLVDFALSDAVLGMATRYLGGVPYLCRVDLVYSLPRPTADNMASQLFHVDPEGLTQVKFFIHMYDVGDSEGPFTFIPADETERIIAEVRALRRRQGKPHSGRYLDEEIHAVSTWEAGCGRARSGCACICSTAPRPNRPTCSTSSDTSQIRCAISPSSTALRQTRIAFPHPPRWRETSSVVLLSVTILFHVTLMTMLRHFEGVLLALADRGHRVRVALPNRRPDLQPPPSHAGHPSISFVSAPYLSLIHISEPTRLLSISYAVFCLK